MTTRPDLWNATVATLRQGLTQEELSEKLSEAVCMARETGKQAKVALEITVKPIGDGQYELRDKITAKIPEHQRGITLMFGTPDGNLMRDDPRQRNLDLRAVDDTPEEFKTVEEN
ncbi:MAG TPA: hypothetical protein ENK05_08690 [Gammaproteobacteria bacterium]|nr:hypothetical protein [Gammaproteobacteria bacterium]